VVLAGVQNGHCTHVGVLIDAHAQRQIGPAHLRREGEDADEWLRVLLDEEVELFDIAFDRLRKCRGDRQRRVRRILGAIRRLHVDHGAAFDELGVREIRRPQQRLPDVDLGLLRGCGEARHEQGGS